MKEIAQQLIAWYHQNKRDLPWRNTQDPYKIWLSEIILQQTRVEQGTPYYLHFIETYPTVFDLANAPEAQVLRSWQGLGYYSRARNLHFAAKEVLAKHKGQFPNNYETLIQLKGVGEYTAAAIASFAFGEAKAVVDGNVFRVLARLFNIATPINTGAGKKEFTVLANQFIDPKNPALFNQAIMEFGAMQCKPSNPDCSVCPFNQYCQSFATNTVSEYPVKSKKTKTRNRYFDFIILSDEKNTILQKREGKDIWQGLYQFPLIESATKNKNKLDLSKSEVANYLNTNSHKMVKSSAIVKHVLSHQVIFAKFWWINMESISTAKDANLIKVPWSHLSDYGMPQLIVKYLENED